MFPYPLVATAVNQSKPIAAELLEPAIDGPPSPESIRAISNQMRRASGIDRQHSRQSHQTTSSGSSSLRSQNSFDRPSWDHTFATATSSLSRQSSGRSINGGQPRERHDSVQIFGRSLFNKKTKLHLESTTQNSSSSSLHSAEPPLEATSSIPPMPPPPKTSHGLPTSSSFGLAGAASSKDSSKHSFFSRRRATRSGPLAEEFEARRKFQISGPYNFQHVTHTDKEELPPPNLRRGSRMFVPSDFTSAPLSQIPADSSLRAIHSESPLSASHSAEAMSSADSAALPIPTRPFTRRPHAASVSVVPSRPQTLFHTLSQDQLRIPPPRPPRSPIESSFSPPVPPRMSSRMSIRYGDFDPLATTTIERPQTSGSFRSPAPLVIPPDVPPRLAHAHSFSADMNVEAMDFRCMAQVLAPPPVAPGQAPPSMDENNWPLACSTLSSTAIATAFEILPGVPEEEEHTNNQNSVRKSHIRVSSNSSSIRESQSLPVMRRMSQRPPSGVSDTLGQFDLLAAQRALQDSMSDIESDSFLPKESWEDAIDYCYEHAVEADCDYVWERLSLDGVSRDSVLADLQCNSSNSSSSTQKEDDGMLSVPAPSPASFDVPFLSPASQTSMSSLNVVVTPTGLSMRRPGLTIEPSPLDDACPTHRYLHVRSSSRASSFKESHGFNLSPTFFIPGSERYDQHCFAPLARPGFALGADEDEDFPLYADPAMDLKHPSSFFASSRASASTTGSRESRDSVLSNRHISATSTATDLTRLTMSTNSIEDLVAKPEIETPQTP